MSKRNNATSTTIVSLMNPRRQRGTPQTLGFTLLGPALQITTGCCVRVNTNSADAVGCTRVRWIPNLRPGRRRPWSEKTDRFSWTTNERVWLKTAEMIRCEIVQVGHASKAPEDRPLWSAITRDHGGGHGVKRLQRLIPGFDRCLQCPVSGHLLRLWPLDLTLQVQMRQLARNVTQASQSKLTALLRSSLDRGSDDPVP